MRLAGEVAVSGGKNAAVALIPAALLAHSPCTIENMPDIEDVHVLIEMLRWLGAGVEFTDGTLRVDPTAIDKYSPPRDLACKMRASYYLAPVLLGLFGCAEVPMPGGCKFAPRCPYASDACRRRPEVTPLPGGRAVLCFHPLTSGQSLPDAAVSDCPAPT
ncbi:MAG: hypothetical protein VB065_07760 [Eubacteriales bacterium]|nr:hypothetical protein [Eubacteriales bacterium]